MRNKDIRQMQDDVISLLNSYDLPIEVKSLVLDYVLRLVKEQADKAIIMEMEEEQNAEST